MTSHGIEAAFGTRRSQGPGERPSPRFRFVSQLPSQGTRMARVDSAGVEPQGEVT
jgi:hypothetical protein